MRSVILAASLLLATPTFATEWVHCGDADDEVTVGALLGGVGFISISAVTLRVPGKSWSQAEVYGPGDPISVAQSQISDSQIILDLTDPDAIDTIAELRVYVAEEGEDYVQGGVLRVPGHGAWIVTCDGP